MSDWYDICDEFGLDPADPDAVFELVDYANEPVKEQPKENDDGIPF